MIKNFNETINQDIKNTKGYRTVPVMIRGSEHIPPAPENVPNLMMYFIHNYNQTLEEDIFYKIARYHIEFESIHPFEDGNGRCGRLLINFELLKQDIVGLANFLKELSNQELERLKSLEF